MSTLLHFSLIENKKSKWTPFLYYVGTASLTEDLHQVHSADFYAKVAKDFGGYCIWLELRKWVLAFQVPAYGYFGLPISQVH